MAIRDPKKKGSACSIFMLQELNVCIRIETRLLTGEVFSGDPTEHVTFS